MIDDDDDDCGGSDDSMTTMSTFLSCFLVKTHISKLRNLPRS